MTNSDINNIDNILPQTQCRECGYDSCLEYAQAICNSQEKISLCAPGGTDVLIKISEITKQDFKQYLDEVDNNFRAPVIAKVRAEECIGCTKCIQACPVDAIIGSAKTMHTILSQECTGCELCISPCPVDCIDLIPIKSLEFNKDKAKQRYLQKVSRLNNIQESKRKNYQTNKQLAKNENHQQYDKNDFIRAALERVNAKKHE